MTTIVKFTRTNSAFSKIITNDAGALQNIREHFTFRIPNAHFNPKVKKGHWDGKIRLVKNGNFLYSGLKSELEKVCIEHEWEFVDETDFHDDELPTYSEVEEFCKSLELKTLGEPLTPRDYQIKYITAALQSFRKLLLCPTNGGKSLIAYVAIRWLLDITEKKKGLLIVPSISLVNQMATDFIDYGWTDDMIHRIYDGAEKQTDKPITISTWQSIQHETEFLHQFDFVIGDEAHGYKAASLVNIMENLVNADFRIGMSGTLDGLTTSRMTIEGLFGSTYKVITAAEMIDKGYSSDLQITAVVLKHSENVRKFIGENKLDYENERAFVYQHKKRNNFLSHLALSLKGNTLLYFWHIDTHGKLIYDALNALNDGSKQIYFIDGQTDVDERERIRAEFEKRDDIIAVVSYGTTSTGSNYKSVHNIIFGSTFKGVVKNLQTIGRGLRKSKTKHKCVLYDIVDDMSWGKRDNYMMKHFKDRLNIYLSEGFKFQVKEISI
jgi:superfamily II DNA or RNA helicase